MAIDPRYYRPTEVDLLLGDPAKAIAEAGLAASRSSFEALVAEMVEADRVALQRTPAQQCLDPIYTLAGKRVWVAGDRGLVGSALVRRLARRIARSLAAPRERVDLRAPDQTERWMREARPQAVFLAAARVGGIYANDRGRRNSSTTT